MTEDIPRIDDDMIERVRQQKGTWTVPSGGPAVPCPSCGEERLMSDHDLVWHEPRPGMLLVVGGLSGYRCSGCGDTWFDSRSVHLIEQHRNAKPTANYEAAVSRVGGNGIGVYFPKDLQRVMGIRPGQRAHITPMSGHAMMIELVEPKKAPRASRKQKRQKKP